MGVVLGPTAAQSLHQVSPGPPSVVETSGQAVFGSLRASRMWAIVLAGGDGTRLQPLVREVCGDDRPKQFAALVGQRSLLRQTLDRVTQIIPADRTVVVVQEHQAKWITPDVLGSPAPRVLLQRANRGTAGAVLLPTAWIAGFDPAAVVAIFPSDHFILEEEAFLTHVASIMAFVDHRPEHVVLLAVPPCAPDPEYGWIEPGEVLCWAPTGSVRRVRRFHEKPDPETTRLAYADGWLWNMFVFAARVSGLLDLGRRALPDLHAVLASVTDAARTGREAEAICDASARMPHYDFSRSIFQISATALAVAQLPKLTWSDLGTPRRVFETVKQLGR